MDPLTALARLRFSNYTSPLARRISNRARNPRASPPLHPHIYVISENENHELHRFWRTKTSRGGWIVSSPPGSPPIRLNFDFQSRGETETTEGVRIHIYICLSLYSYA